MALIKCPECGKDISDTINQCIHCGYVLKKKKTEASSPKQSGVKVLSMRGEPPMIVRTMMYVKFIASLLAFVVTVLFFVFAFSTMIGIIIGGIVFGFIGIVFLILFIDDLLKIKKNSKNEKPCIEYDYDNDKIIIYTIDEEQLAIDITRFYNLSYGFWSTSNTLMLLCIDDKGKIKWFNLGYPLTNVRETKNALAKLKRNK